MDSIIRGDAASALPYAGAVLGFWVVGAARRALDTRTFTRIYADLAVLVILNRRAQRQSTSKAAARLVLARDSVDFFEKHVPTIATALVSIVGAAGVLLVIEPRIGLACLLGLLLCIMMTLMLRETAERVCQDSLVLVHEGGYSEANVPFCGLATLEELSGVRTAVKGPMLELIQLQQPNEAVLGFQRAWIDQLADGLEMWIIGSPLRTFRRSALLNETPQFFRLRSAAGSAGLRRLSQTMVGPVEIHQPLVSTALANSLDLTVENTVGSHFVYLSDTAIEIHQRVEHHRRTAFQRGPLGDGEAFIHRQRTVGEGARQLLMITT